MELKGIVDYEYYKKRYAEANGEEELEQVFREIVESALRWRVSRKGSIVEMLKPELISCNYKEKEIVLRYPMQAWEQNPIGTLHGGITATMLDNQGGLLTQSLALCFRTPTIYLNINYTSPLMMGDNLIVRVWCTHFGKRTVNVMGEAKAEATGKMIATAMVGYMVIDHEDKK